MKRILLLWFMLLAAAAHAQFATVTATVTDANGHAYTNCKGSASFVNQNTTPGSPVPNLSGSTFQTEVPISNCDATGTFSMRLARNDFVQPTPSQWKFTIASSDGVTNFSCLATVSGSNTVNLSTTISACAPPLVTQALTDLTAGGLIGGTWTGNWTAAGNIAGTGTNVWTGANAFSHINKRVYADQSSGADLCAKVLTAATSLGSAGGIIDATGFTPGSTQTCAAAPLTNIEAPLTLITGPYTISFDPTVVTWTFPSYFHWDMRGTTVLDSNPSGVAIQGPLTGAFTNFVTNSIHATTGSITSGTATLTVANATGFQVGGLVGIIGAGGGNSNQQTTTNGATGTGASFTVTSTSGWDVGGATLNYLIIESEILSCTGGTGTTFTGCSRGLYGTAAVSHANGVNVTAIPLFESEIKAVAGTTITLADNATTTVTGAPTYTGVTQVVIDGQGTFTGNQPQTGIDNDMACLNFQLSTQITIGNGIYFTKCEHAGVGIVGTRGSLVQGTFQYNGHPAAQLGADIWCFGQCIGNAFRSTAHRAGNIAIIIDDRSTSFSVLDGSSNNNSADIGPVYNNTPYSFCTIIEGGSSNNTVFMPRCLSSVMGIEIDAGQWTTNPTPSNNVIMAGYVDGGAGQAIQTSGFTGTSNNAIFVGPVNGSQSNIAGTDRIIGAISSHSTLYALGLTRSAGLPSSADIFGDDVHALVIGGKSDSSGTVSFGATTQVSIPYILGFSAMLIQNTAPTITGFGTSPSVVSSNGTAAFTINVGTGGTATNGVIHFPTATNGWNVSCEDLTTQSATVFLTRVIAPVTTSSVTVANFNTTGAQAAWSAGDVLSCTALAR